MLKKILICIAICFGITSAIDLDTINVDSFPISFEKPLSWTTYRQEQSEDFFQVSYGLPKVWSDLENCEIENAIAVVAIRDSSITSLSDAVSMEFSRIKNILISSKEVSSEMGKSFITTTEIQGVRYKSFVTIIFRNGVSYLMSLTATNGTFDINLPVFKGFMSSVIFKTDE